MEDMREPLDYLMDEWPNMEEPLFTWPELDLMFPEIRWRP